MHVGSFARCISELEEYNYSIQYLPGQLNTKADALSRLTSMPVQANQNEIENFFEGKLYSIQTQSPSFRSNLKQEQEDDLIIGPAKRIILTGDITKQVD